ncbi:MAG: hypothetical protein HC896_17470 [Bacteroidales bacterium]|nr:hypothetical protein [Bacteroidales bacterium]
MVNVKDDTLRKPAFECGYLSLEARITNLDSIRYYNFYDSAMSEPVQVPYSYIWTNDKGKQPSDTNKLSHKHNGAFSETTNPPAEDVTYRLEIRSLTDSLLTAEVVYKTIETFPE